MQSIRQVIPHAPASIAIPEEFRDRPIEVIIRPLPEQAEEAATTDADQAFGLWRRQGAAVDGLEYQERLRSEWPE